MCTIKQRFIDYLEKSQNREFIGANYLDDALNAFRYIYPNKQVEYADPDLYSPLLYRMWGELLIKKGIIDEFSVIFKNYRYIMDAKYDNGKSITLGSDGLLSFSKRKNESIYEHRYIGGFALWPSHRGGINFRKNRYHDDIFKTLTDIHTFYETGYKEYSGVIPQKDYDWFKYLRDWENFSNIFYFDDYSMYENELLEYEAKRTKDMVAVMHKNLI